MADYVVNVKAKLDITQYKEDLKNITLSKTFTVKLEPEVRWKEVLTNDSIGDLDGLKDKIKQWFANKDNRIPLGFTYQKGQDLENNLKSIRDAIVTIGKVAIPIDVKEKDLNTLTNVANKLKSISTSIESINGKQIISFNVPDAQQFASQIDIIKDVLKDFQPVSIKIAFETESLNKLFEEITKIQNSLKELKNINIKPSNNLVRNITNSLQDIKIGIDFNEEQKENLKKSISDLNLLLNSLRKVEIETNISQEQKDKLHESIKEIDLLLNSLKIIEIGINFNQEQKSQFEKDIESIKNKEQEISNIDVSINLQKEEKDKLKFKEEPLKIFVSPNLNQLRTFRSEINNWIKDNAIIATLSKNDDNLSHIKGEIDTYFASNPISLVIADKTDGLDLSSFTKAWEEASETAKNFTADTILEQKIKLQDYFNELRIQRENDKLSEEEYAKKLRELTEDTENQRILNYKSKGTEYLKIRQELYNVEASIERKKVEETKRMAEESKNAWIDALNKAFEGLKNNNNFQEFQNTLDFLKDQGENLNISGFQEYYDQILQLGKNYLAQREQQENEAREQRKLQREQEQEQELESLQQEANTRSEIISSMFNDYNNSIEQQISVRENLQKESNERLLKQKEEEIEKEKELEEKYLEIYNKSSKQIIETTENQQDYLDKILAEKRAERHQKIQQENEKKLKLIQEEEEKETNILQEQAHTRSEIVSSMFEDYYNSVDNGLNALQNLEKEHDFSQYTSQQAEEVKKVLNNLFVTDMKNILRNYQRDVTNFEAYNDDAWKRIRQAYEQGVDQELLQKEQDKWNKLAKSHEQALNKIDQQRQKEAQKAEEERQKEEQRVVAYLEKMKKEIEKEKEDEVKAQEEANKKKEEDNKKAIAKDLSDIQDLYNKKLISAEEYVSQMKNVLPRAFEAGVDGAKKFQNSVDKVEKELREAKAEAESFDSSFKKLSNSANNIFNSLMRYFGVTQVINAVTGSFSKMIQEVRDLDVELTEFAKVSDLSIEETNKFIDNAYELGGAVAKTGKEVITATTLFKKMGYTVDESMKFAKDALMWTNVADGMVSVEEASNMLISTMKAFGEETTNTTHIIDALNEVSNNYSTSSSALSNNLSTVAATLASSGVSLEQTIGLMTAGIEIMPDKASKVANGLKTISQRIRQIDGATAEKLDEFLGSKGKSRYDELTGQLKSTYDILSEVAELWPKLTTNERQFFGEVMAGKNQITVLNALMTNFQTAINATGTAINSENSAFKENERVMNSIEGHIQNFKKAFSELSKDLVDSDIVKQVIDFGTKVIEWLDDIVKNRGPLLIKIIASIGGAIGALKIAQLTKQVGTLIQTITSGNLVFAGIAAAIGAVTFVISEFVQEQEKANKKAQELKEIAKDYLNDEQKTSEQRTESIKESIEQYEKLKKQLESLPFGKERDKVYEQLIEIETQLKNQDINIDLINGSYEEQISLLKQAYAEEKKITLEQKKRARKKEQEDFDPVKNVASKTFDADYTIGSDGLFGNAFKSDEQKIEEDIENINNIIVSGIRTTKITLENGQQSISDIYGKSVQEILNDATLSEEQKIEIFKKAIIQYDNMAESAAKSAQKASDLVEQGIISGDTTLENTSRVAQENYEKQEEVFSNYAGALTLIVQELEENSQESAEIAQETRETVIAQLDALGVSLNDFSSSSLQALIDTIEKIDTENLDISELSPEYQKFSEILSDTEFRTTLLTLAQEALKVAFNKEAQAAEDAAEGTDSFSGSTDNLQVSLSGAMATMDNYVNSMELLNQAHMEFENNGEITAETLRKIADAGLESYLIIDEQTKSLDVNRDAFWDDNKSIEENAIVSYVAGQRTKLLADLTDESTNASNDHTQASDEEKIAVDNLAKALEDASDEAAVAAATQMVLNDAIANGTTVTEANIDAVTARIKVFVAETRAGIEALHTLFNTSSTSSGRTGTTHSVSHGSGSGSSYDNSAREAEQAAKDAQTAWKNAFEVEYKKLQSYLDAEIITYEEYYDSLEALNQKFFAGRAEFEEEYWKYQDEIVKGRKKYYENELKDYFQKGEKLLEHQLALELIDEEQYYASLTTLYETYYTDKEKYEEEYWKLQEQIYEYQKKKLENLYKEIEELHKEYIKSLEEESDNYDTAISYAIDVLDEEIDRLNKEKEAIKDSNEELEKSIKLRKLEDDLEKAKSKRVRVYRKGQGFVYEQDIDAIAKAQEAFDEAQREEEYNQRIKLIDDEIDKLQEYKKEWENITKRYKKSQDEMTASLVLGEAARERLLNREKDLVDSVSDNYFNLQDTIQRANNATIDNLTEFIGDESQANSFTAKINEINAQINSIKDKEVSIAIDDTSFQNVIDHINELLEKLNEINDITININDECPTQGCSKNSSVCNKDSGICSGYGCQGDSNNYCPSNKSGYDPNEAIYLTDDYVNSYPDTHDGNQLYFGSGPYYVVGEDAYGNVKLSSSPGGAPILIVPKTAIKGNKGDDGCNKNDICSGDSECRTDGDTCPTENFCPSNKTGYDSDKPIYLNDEYVALQALAGKELYYGSGPYYVVGEDANGNVKLSSSPGGAPILVVPPQAISGHKADDDKCNPDEDCPYEAYCDGNEHGSGCKRYRDPDNPCALDYGWYIPPDDCPIQCYDDNYCYTDTICYTDADTCPTNCSFYDPHPGCNTYDDPSCITKNAWQHPSYNSGTLGTPYRNFMVNENGIEAMVTPDGTVISAPSAGYGVIKNEYTKRLTDFASDPLGFLSKMFSGFVGNYQKDVSKNEVININGNLNLPNVTDGESFVNSIRTVALQYTTRRK